MEHSCCVFSHPMSMIMFAQRSFSNSIQSFAHRYAQTQFINYLHFNQSQRRNPTTTSTTMKEVQIKQMLRMHRPFPIHDKERYSTTIRLLKNQHRISQRMNIQLNHTELFPFPFHSVVNRHQSDFEHRRKRHIYLQSTKQNLKINGFWNRISKLFPTRIRRPRRCRCFHSLQHRRVHLHMPRPI